MLRTASLRSFNRLLSYTIYVDRFISSDIPSRDLRSFDRYVSSHEHKCCPIDLHVVCNLPMDITQRNWKYVDIYETSCLYHVDTFVLKSVNLAELT